MKARVIHTRFWTDEYINSLTTKEKLFFLYLITNEYVNISGVYELPEMYVSIATGLTKAEIPKLKEKFQLDGKFVFHKAWVRIVNVERYQQYTGEKNDSAKGKELSIAPKELLNVNTLSIGYRGTIDSPSNKKSVISNKNIGRESLRERETVDSLKALFPNVDVEDEIDAMFNWLDSKGTTKKDYVAFAKNWLKKTVARKKLTSLYSKGKVVRI